MRRHCRAGVLARRLALLMDVVCGVWVCCKAAGPGCLVALIAASAVGCRFLTDQKAAEKVAPSSEAGGTAQGDLGPLENPLGLDGVDRELQRLQRRKACAGSFSVSRFAKAHPVSRLDSDPLPQVGMGWLKGLLLSRKLFLPGGTPSVGADDFHRPAVGPGGWLALPRYLPLPAAM